MGYQLPAPLLAFYRGIFSVLASASRVRPVGDTLLEAVEEAWATEIFDPLRKMPSIGVLGETLNKYAAAMLELPRRLDEILSLAERDRTVDHHKQARSENQNFGKSSTLAALLLLVAVVVLARSSTLLISSLWADRISFVACCLIGLLVLRMAS
jgi:hypothetical protein